MYIPSAFTESDPDQLHDFIVSHSFATLISQGEDEPFASHLPLLLDIESDTTVFLRGHMARANPQWQSADGQRVLAIFPGPHAYISPSWYHEENVVPTWNYVAVHVYGTLHITDEEQLRQIVHRTVVRYEQPRADPWSYRGSANFEDRLMKMIVGFEIEVDRIEGK